MNPTLIFCAGNNPRAAHIAINAGFKYGAQLPGTVYAPLYFADQNFKEPNKEVYIKLVAKYKPHMASVIDWESPVKLPEILEWAEDIAPFVNVIMVIPKVHNCINLLPREIGGKPIRLGYSVPTTHGGTSLMVSEFYGWPVHLLGGSPQKQKEIAYYMNVVSIDGNMALKMANKYCAYFDPEKKHERGYWPSIKDTGIIKEIDANYEAFYLSCKNIMRMWGQI